MAKTREQKEQEAKDFEVALSTSGGFIVVSFGGVSVNKLNVFRNKVRNANGSLRVAKKRILKLVFEKLGISLELNNTTGQVGLLTYNGALLDVAGIIHKFTDDCESVMVFGGFDIAAKSELSVEYIEYIGQLPSRETLLTMVVGTIAAPLRGLLHVLKGIEKVATSE